jgi:hypothetical protein
MMVDLLEEANLSSLTPKSRLSIQGVLHKKVFITFRYEDCRSVYYQSSWVIVISGLKGT